MLGYAGFDWVLIDCEHGSIGPADVEVMAMACDAVGITSIARPKTNAASDIQAVMDRGVMGVQVPHINTGEEARRAVRCGQVRTGSATRTGGRTRPDRRGLGGRLPDFAQPPMPSRSFACSWSTRLALSNIADLLAVEGIDVFFIGPSDLSQSMGSARQSQGTAGGARYRGALAKIVAAGCIAGMPATVETLAQVKAGGCRYIYTHLPRLIGAAAGAFLSQGREGC